MEAAKLLEASGIDATVVNTVRIKPFAKEYLLQRAVQARLLVTVEEHNVMGGLGSILAEVLTEHGAGSRLLRIGLQDTFAEGYSNNQQSVRKQNDLGAESIAKRVMEALQ